MKNKLIIILSVVSLLFSGVGSGAAEWLDIDTGIRSIGMGTAQVAAGRGISASAYNPANLAFIDKREAFFNKTNYIVDMSHVYIGYATPLSPDEFAGFNVFMFDSGDIAETQEIGLADETGEAGYYKVSNFLFKALYARNIGEQFKIGASLKYMREDIDDMYMQGVGFDAGASYSMDALGLIFGASVTNLGPDVAFEGKGLEYSVDSEDSADGVLVKTTESFSLPTTLRVGVESQLMGPTLDAFIENDLLSLSLAFDGISSADSYFYSTLGAEFGFNDMLFARAGIYMGHDTKELSFGLGLKYNWIRIDYALTNYGVLGSTSQWGVGIDF
jgi:hypothetical protein